MAKVRLWKEVELEVDVEDRFIPEKGTIGAENLWERVAYLLESQHPSIQVVSKNTHMEYVDKEGEYIYTLVDYNGD